MRRFVAPPDVEHNHPNSTTGEKEVREVDNSSRGEKKKVISFWTGESALPCFGRQNFNYLRANKNYLGLRDGGSLFSRSPILYAWDLSLCAGGKPSSRRAATAPLVYLER